MGALSFAADTIASLSTVFAQKNSAVARVNLNNLTLQLDEQARRIFIEFSSGMQMLYKHGSRNPCNIGHITCQNLKLLHTNLKANSSFKDVLKKVRQNSHDAPHWAWLPLLSNDEISAGVLYLSKNFTLAPYKSGSNIAMRQNELKLPFNNSFYHQNVRQLYIALAGNSKMELHNSQNTSDIYLKCGEVFAEPRTCATIKSISAYQENSLMLNIQLTSH